MNINNYMTVKEAAHRWGVKPTAIREKLNLKRRPALKYDIENGLVKYFKADGSAYGEWIISKKAMEQWYGSEPNRHEDKYDKFFRLLQSKVGLNDVLSRKLLEHFSPDFIVNMAFQVYEKRMERQKKISDFEMIMGPTTSEELVFEIFKYTVEREVAFRHKEEVADIIFDGDYADFYPSSGYHGVIGVIYIKKQFSDTVLEKMKELAGKCQLALRVE